MNTSSFTRQGKVKKNNLDECADKLINFYEPLYRFHQLKWIINQIDLLQQK